MRFGSIRMIYIVISVLCSVAVATLLKFARSRGMDVYTMIAWNYPSTVVLTYLLFRPNLSALGQEVLPWQLYVPTAVLLPSLFVILSCSLKYAGLVRTEVSQRMSLLISLTAAFFLFHEQFGVGRLIGVAVGVVSILLMIGWQKQSSVTLCSGTWVFPLLVFIGYGIVDILFKSVALYKAVPYTTSMFILFSGAMILSLAFWIVRGVIRNGFRGWKSVVCGLGLGMFNFANILFYMKAHQHLSDSPSIVFTAMNIGVIGIGSLVGVFFFKEQLSWLNRIGLLLSVVAVLLISLL